MLKITPTAKSLADSPKKFTRLLLTEEPLANHRFVESAEGTTTYKMGVGKWSKIDARSFRTIIRSIIQAAKSHKVESLAVDFSVLNFSSLKNYGESWVASTIAENFLLANYEFTTYKTGKKAKDNLKEILITNLSSKEAIYGLKRGITLGEYTNQVRDIANTPACDMSPTNLGDAAKRLASGTKVQVKVLKEVDIKKLKMGALLAVGGS
ncbi:MAG: M17 family peptidase N-terminal domain-containing protein [Candidatus Paceibacterota bacterium]